MAFPKPTSPAPRELFEPDRLLAFSDGVFAVAITLLVIDLRLPPTPAERGDQALLDAMLTMVPMLLIFAFTFVIVGLSWLGHHRKFTYIRKVDSGLLWFNLLYLMTLCLVPFATSVVSAHSSRYAFILYAALMSLNQLLSASMSVYGLRTPFLGGREMSPRTRQDMILSPVFTAVVFLISGGLAFCGLLRIARWSLLLIIPVSAYLGPRRSKRARSLSS